MSNKKKTIKLTNEQFERLERLLDYEIDQEYNYQLWGDFNTEYIGDLIDLYEAIHLGNADGFFEAIVYEDLVNKKKALIKEILDYKAFVEKEKNGGN